MSIQARAFAWGGFVLTSILTWYVYLSWYVYVRGPMIDDYYYVMIVLGLVSLGFAFWIFRHSPFSWHLTLLLSMGLIIGQWWVVQMPIIVMFWWIRGFAP